MPSKFALNAQDGAIAFDVVCQRNGYDGPINLSIEPPSAGLMVLNPTIPASVPEAKVVLCVQDTSAIGDLQLLKLVGTAEIDGRTLLHPRSARWRTCE